ncbi:hypothetical protein MMC19_000273 [Ptychographa xylographoides]|nr:hypothetical protein [Ptychographa xylographoides]
MEVIRRLLLSIQGLTRLFPHGNPSEDSESSSGDGSSAHSIVNSTNDHVPVYQVLLTQDTEVLEVLRAVLAENTHLAAAVTDPVTKHPLLLIASRLLELTDEIRSMQHSLNRLSKKSIQTKNDITELQNLMNKALQELQDVHLPDDRRDVVEATLRRHHVLMIKLSERKVSLDKDVNLQTRYIKNAHAECFAHLEEALVAAQILRSRKDSGTHRRQGRVSSSMILLLEEAEYTEPDARIDWDEVWNLPLEVQVRNDPSKAVMVRLIRAMDHVAEVEELFASRRAIYHKELQAYRDGVENGTRSDTLSDFDRAYVRKVSRMTAEVIRARADFKEIATRAKKEGLVPYYTQQESNFGSRSSDGYPLSHEVRTISRVNSSDIETWNDAVRKGLNLRWKGHSTWQLSHKPPKAPEEVWDAPEVLESDSFSVLATNGERKRIDRWQEECSRRRKRVRTDSFSGDHSHPEDQS